VKFVIESKSRNNSTLLAFEIVAGKLICLGDMAGSASIRVPAFDPEFDISFRTPEKLSPEELKNEIAIHFPEHLLERTGRKVVASSMMGAVLLQPQAVDVTAISPISALAEVVKKVGSVNSAMLEAANDGLLFVRRSGDDLTAHFSTHSITEFAALSEKERDDVFSDFSALEILVSGPDVSHFTDFDLDRIQFTRKIAMSDLESMCNFSEEGSKLVELNPALYTTVIGAASIIATIASEVAS